MAPSVRREVPRKPVAIASAFRDPERVRRLVVDNAPYWPVLRYIASPAEMRAAGATSQTRNVGNVMPWFRGDWATATTRIDGVDEILGNEAFVSAAREVFDAAIVRPHTVYVNLMAGLPGGEAHLDVPAYRGIDRNDYPVWLLNTMNRSALFDEWRVEMATAVAWLYRGKDGAFDYWPGGPDEDSQRVADLDNRAVVGDNEVMFHRVASMPPQAGGLPQGDFLRCELERDEAASGWSLVEDGKSIARYAGDDVRVSVSWKADVFADAAAEALRDSHEADLDLARVVQIFLADLEERGRGISRPEDPVRDTAFIEALNDAYALPALRYPDAGETERLNRARH